MPIGISSGTIRNKKATVKIEDKVKKIVQTYGNLYFLTENGVLSGVGLNNSVQITGSVLTDTTARYLLQTIAGKNVYSEIAGSFIPEWYLTFSLIFTNNFTQNLNYVYSTNTKIFNQYKFLDFDAGYTYADNTDFIVSLFKNFCFFINENGELYGWGFNANQELSISSDVTGTLRLPSYQTSPNAWEYGNTSFPTYRPKLKALQESLQNKTVFKPTKLNNSTNWKSIVANNVAEYYKHILLNSNGEIYTFGGDLNPPVKIGSSTDWKYISYDYAINNNNELYRLRDVQYPIIYNTNALIGGGQALGDGNSTLVNPLCFLNYGEKIKKVVASNTSRDVILLTESGKLSGIGINNLSLLGGIPTNQYKLSAIPNITDTIKDVVISRNSAYAYTNDNSLLVWGTNLNSRLGTGSTAATLTTPTKVLSGLVSEVVPLSTYTLVLGNNGTVSAAGKNETYGILGTNDTTNKTSFTKLTGLAGVKQLVGNNTRNYALGTNGLLSGWGMGGGLLGDVPTITKVRRAIGSVNCIAIENNNNVYFSTGGLEIFKYDPNTDVVSTYHTITNFNSRSSIKGLHISGTELFVSVRGVDTTNPTRTVAQNSRIIALSGNPVTQTIMGGTGNQDFLTIESFRFHQNGTNRILENTNTNGSGVFIVCTESGLRSITRTTFSSIDYGSTSSTCSATGGLRSGGFGTSVVNVAKPLDICAEDNNRFIYITTQGCGNILKSDTLTSPYNTQIIATGLFGIRGITINGSTLYFIHNHAIKSMSINGGTISILQGSENTSGYKDGTTGVLFNRPTFLRYFNGFLYVSDTGNNTIRRININTTETITLIVDSVQVYSDRLSAVPIPYVRNIDKIFVSGVGNSVFTLGTNKEVSAWGSNSFGQLGLNTTTNSPTAVRLPLSNIKDIKISYQITNNDVYANPTVFFLSETGGLSGCGFNGSGQLGNNTTTNSLSITKIEVPPVKKLYTDAHGAVYAVGTNDELSGWGNKTSYSFIPNVLSAYKYTNVGPVDYLVVNDTLYKGSNNGAVAVGLNKRLTAWGINPLVDKNSLVIGQNIPTEVTNVTDISAVFVNPISANNMFINGTLVTPLTTREYTGLIKIGTNEWKTVDKHADYAIKLDNTLWSISGVPVQIGTDTDYENVFYGTPVKISDPFDIKITTTQYFSSTDTDTVNSLSVIKPERTVVNLRQYDYNARFIGVSANTLHGTVTDYRASSFNSANFKLDQPTSVKY
jgi:alpha-tubulin suppressor-like RCC1 family protein